MRGSGYTAGVVFVALMASAGLAVTPARAAGQSCPGRSFDEFASRFLEDPAVQAAFTAPTVLRTEVVDTNDPPKVRTERISGASVRSLYLDPAKRRRLGLTDVRVSEAPARIVISKPDTDFVFALTFERTTCWVLTRVDDESL